jgi:hypothetical protein
MRRERFVGDCVELAGACIALDRSVKMCRIERFEPRAEARKLAWALLGELQ